MRSWRGVMGEEGSLCGRPHSPCVPASDAGPALTRKGTMALLGSPSLFAPSFHAGIRLKMSYGFPPVRIAETDKVPSQEENEML